MVSGSRDWPEDLGWRIRARINDLPRDAVILHGDARGVDRIAHFHAVFTGRDVRRFWPANNIPSPRKYHARNDQMLDEADLVLAFWDGKSRGTASVIRKARERGIPVEVIAA